VPKASEARYARQYAGKPATEEARARHILVSAEDAAKRLIAELNKGADFPTLARQISKDPDHENGGDLGFFRHDQVWPEFADEAFAVATGQFSQAPIHNEFGWQIVKVEERRIVAPPAYSGVHDAIRQELPQGGVAAHDLRGAVPADDPQTEHRWHTSGGGAGYHAGPGAGEIRGQPAKAVILVGLSLVRS
jgi:peptidyl-prolyl cis-trans isomerase C